jgi:hypothetical protein
VHKGTHNEADNLSFQRLSAFLLYGMYILQYTDDNMGFQQADGENTTFVLLIVSRWVGIFAEVHKHTTPTFVV